MKMRIYVLIIFSLKWLHWKSKVIGRKWREWRRGRRSGGHAWGCRTCSWHYPTSTSWTWISGNLTHLGIIRNIVDNLSLIRSTVKEPMKIWTWSFSWFRSICCKNYLSGAHLVTISWVCPENVSSICLHNRPKKWVKVWKNCWNL